MKLFAQIIFIKVSMSRIFFFFIPFRDFERSFRTQLFIHYKYRDLNTNFYFFWGEETKSFQLQTRVDILLLTCTLASGRLVHMASRSLITTSG